MTDPHSDPPSTDDEPETPVWLPALGFALFILGGVAWAVTPPVVSATPPPLPAPSVVAAPPPPPAQTAPPAPPQPTATAPANPPPALPRPGSGPPKRMMQGGAPGAPGAPSAPGGLPPRPVKNHP